MTAASGGMADLAAMQAQAAVPAGAGEDIEALLAGLSQEDRQLFESLTPEQQAALLSQIGR